MLEKIFNPETYSMLGTWAMTFCKNLVIAIVVYLVGKFIINAITKFVRKLLKKSKKHKKSKAGKKSKKKKKHSDKKSKKKKSSKKKRRR